MTTTPTPSRRSMAGLALAAAIVLAVVATLVPGAVLAADPVPEPPGSTPSSTLPPPTLPSPYLPTTFVISANQGGPGTVIQVSGTGCILPPDHDYSPGEYAEYAGVDMRPEPYINQYYGSEYSSPGVRVRPDGSWAEEFIITPTAPPGQYVISVSCTTDDMAWPIDEREMFTVLDRRAATVQIGPTTGTLGDSLTVTGANCATTTGVLSTAIITMYDTTGTGVASAVTPIAADATFAATLTIDGAATPGPAKVEARCNATNQSLMTTAATYTIETSTTTQEPPPPPEDPPATNGTVTGTVQIGTVQPGTARPVTARPAFAG